MKVFLRALVRRRADNRCEYCRLHQNDYPLFTFHVEHIIAKKHRGQDHPENLALACHLCNLFKGANLSGIDPVSGKVVSLFHPRRQKWGRHFRSDEGWIIGRTQCGRATIEVLKMNLLERVEVRKTLEILGLFPPNQ